MNSYKRLMNNSIIFALGTFGSKFISFLLVPLYTYYLTPNEYGTIDIVVITVSALLPVISFSIRDAVFRFAIEKDSPKVDILTNALVISIGGFGFVLLLYPLLNYFGFLGAFLPYMYLILLLEIIQSVLTYFIRASGQTKLFAINGIILTFTIGILNILFLVYFKMGINGYFYSLLLSYSISIIFIAYKVKVHNFIKISRLNLKFSKKLLYYSIPLIPNSLMWTLINTASRYLITIFIGFSANGLFAIASKLPLLIDMVAQVFYQSWQQTALEEKDNINLGKFYSTVFHYYSSSLFLIISMLLVILKFFFNVMFASEYYLSWQVTTFLLLATAFSSFSSFLGVIYIVTKETKDVFKTSLYGGITSLVLNIILIPLVGIIGAGISSLLSFVVMFLIRSKDAYTRIGFTLNWNNMFFNLLLISLQILNLFSNINLRSQALVNIILLVFSFYINKSIVLLAIEKVYKIIKKTKN